MPFSQNKHLVFLFLVLFPLSSHAGWLDKLNGLLAKDSDSGATNSIALLADDEVIDGLKEALSKGTESAVKYLGRKDGFLGNPSVKLPMPAPLQKVEKGLRGLGQAKIADSFVETMNRAAEQAVPEAATIFSDAIKSMSITDAKNILTGPDNAATEYFKKSGSSKLYDKFLPVVKTSTDNVGVTSRYKELVDKLGPVSGFMDTGSLDLDSYITNKALDGLFLMVASEEKKIRKNPAARTTELLKKVFGAE